MYIKLNEFSPSPGQEWNPQNYPHSGWYWLPGNRQVMYVSKEPCGAMPVGACWASANDIPWVEVLKMIAIIEHPETAKELLK